jgi:hypothetical protein
MASLQQKGNGWYCQFLHHGKRHTFAVGSVSTEEADRPSLIRSSRPIKLHEIPT